MEIEEVREMKKALEMVIAESVAAFVNVTGLSVDSIRLEKSISKSNTGEVISSKVSIFADVRL